MNDIVRFGHDARFNQVVVHGGIVYLAGVTASAVGGIEAQTKEVLGTIDRLLESAGSDKSRLLSVQIWLKDIARDFAAMNALWVDWLPSGSAPTRATCEANLAAPDFLIEVIVTAAVR